jgi:endo-cleaving rubber dioxygenase
MRATSGIAGLLASLLLAACAGDYETTDAPPPGAPATPEALPLLGSSHARSYMDLFCEDRADDARLPPDPRELIRPGVNQNKAVAFNAYWEDCNGSSNQTAAKPKTCGEFRSRAAAGRQLMRQGLAQSMLDADAYNRLWQRWGLNQRPADFDAQLRERYGLPEAPFHNPYPLPGEDPAATNGGSGQLPAGLAQMRDTDGRYAGDIGITCDICHSGQLDALAARQGNGFVSGLGAHTADFLLLLSDATAPLPIGLNASRGVTNAMGLSGLLIGLLDIDSLGLSPETTLLLQLPGNTSGAGDTKMPAWWNASHRPRKFWDGGFSYDATRLDSAILNLTAPTQSPLGHDKDFNRRLRDKIEQESIDAQLYIDTLRAPQYPGAVDSALAEQGAVLFHAKDLWASGVNDHIPRPPTNGSCAGCHGVYAPRYAHDPTFLEDPQLAGIAGYIAPIEQIRTDPERLRGFTPALLELMSTSWFSYPEGAPGYVSPDDKSPLQERLDDLLIFTPGARPPGACTWQGFDESHAIGYLTPPLHGVWATAPYLHNGAVPDIWSVLDPDQRPQVWRRQLSTGPGSERGFDTGLDAYDHDRLGWKHEVLSCADGGVPYLSCAPEAPLSAFTAVVEFINRLPGSLNSVGYVVAPPMNRQTVEARKVFNGFGFAKSPGGHDFTRALNDAERRALIEYLKTL